MRVDCFPFVFGQALRLLCLLGVVTTAFGAEPLLRAHAHNDYAHHRPLADALSHRFWSVEADVWLVNDRLLIGHDLRETAPDKTLQNLYLDPLRTFIKKSPPAENLPPFTLLIDVKSEAEATWVVLHEALKNYRDVLTRFEADRIHDGSITVLISGNRAAAAMRTEPVRLAALDGRLPDLDANPPVALTPLISDNWIRHFQWRGSGPLPDDERAKLRKIVGRAHEQGRRLRFWAVPDNAAAWKELLDAGVDLLNTDKLEEMEAFLSRQKSAVLPR